MSSVPRVYRNGSTNYAGIVCVCTSLYFRFFIFYFLLVVEFQSYYKHLKTASRNLFRISWREWFEAPTFYIFSNISLRSVAPLRFPLEVHVQSGEAAVLRRAGPTQSPAPGAIPRLQIQTSPEAHLHRRGQTTAGGRVQSHDEEQTTGAARAVPSEVSLMRDASSGDSPPSSAGWHISFCRTSKTN